MSIEARTRPTFRPDLEGLRGLAILLVIACHAAIPGAFAGFVGVDVFFVLSGFLITGLLVGEVDRSGRVDLIAFYARRARRILPAAAVVLVATLAVATIVLSPLDVPQISSDALAAVLSLANVHFALSSTDYFAPVDPSPVLHFWSLSVEEQFYLAWPALLVIGARLRRPRLGMTLICGIVLLGSLGLTAWLTPLSGPWAYYSLPTRAWQLAAGGAVALSMGPSRRMPAVLAAPVGWLGLIGLAGSLLVIDAQTPYPGIAAAVPTVSTVALIVAGSAAGSPGAFLLSLAPMRWLGRISYSLYLWHWPVLILGPAVIGSVRPGLIDDMDPMALSLALVAASVALAALSWRLIEEPFRVGRLSTGGHRRSLATAGAAVIAITIGSTSIGFAVQREVAAAELDGPTVGTDTDRPTTSRDRPLVFDPDTWTPDAQAPTSSSAPSSTPEPAPVVATPTDPVDAVQALISGKLPSRLRPSLSRARDDDSGLVDDGCALELGGTEPPICAYGDAHGARTVVLVGDSHAMSWFPALERLADRHHWRLIPLTKYSCVFVDMRVWSPWLDREYTECARWRDRVVARVRQIKPDLVVIASTRWFPTIDAGDDSPERQGDAMARLIERIPGRVAILVDTPRSAVDVPACLAQHRAAIEACTTRRADAFTWRHRRREREAARETGATLVDLSDQMCPTDPCPPIIDGRIVYRDHHHLTATFAATLAPALDAELEPLLQQ
jgi:peptidoglycan/LPS O-acetylase OafA/YrhL